MITIIICKIMIKKTKLYNLCVPKTTRSGALFLKKKRPQHHYTRRFGGLFLKKICFGVLKNTPKGQALFKAEASKVAKHEKACLENQHVFVPFAFDAFGGLAPNAVRLLNRVQKVVNSNYSSLKVSNFVFSRIGFSIQKGVAAQLVARLPCKKKN
ncbi:hypothetical protein Hanom_Chr15g01339701 [Helianthus anomalus]